VFERGISLPVNATAFPTNFKGDWSSATGLPHTLLTSSDTLTYIQLVNHMGTVNYKVAEASGSVTGITMTNGMPLTLPSATITPLTSLTAHDVSWNIPNYQSQQIQMAVHPAATVSAHEYHLGVLGAPASNGWIGWAPDLVTIVQPSGSPMVSVSLSYGNPFPGYPTFCNVATLWTVSYQLPGTMTAASIPTYPMSSHDPSCGTNAGPILTPAQNVKVEGMPWSQSTTMATTTTLTPTLSWTAPQVGKPTRYDLVVWRLGMSAGATTTPSFQALHTTDTSITIPPGVLTSGVNYVFVLQAAMSCPNCDADPARYTLPASFAPTFSGIYKPM
jgi:hypothetical protein